MNEHPSPYSHAQIIASLPPDPILQEVESSAGARSTQAQVASAVPLQDSDKRRIGDHALNKALSETAPGCGDSCGLDLACQLRDNRFSEADAMPFLTKYAHRATADPAHPFTEHDAERWWRSANTRPPRDPWQPQGDNLCDSRRSQDDHPQFHPEQCTDLANAYRLAKMFADHLIYDPSTGWRIYDEGEGRYRKASDGEVERMAHKVTQSILDEVKGAKELKAAEALAKWAVKSMSAERLVAMVKIARSILSIKPEHLDPDPWLLNCRNVVVDLRTGKLLPHEKKNMMTRMVNADYRPGATHEVFNNFLGKILPDKGLRRYCQKLFGISLIGEQVEDLFILVYGPAATGKTTMSEALRRMMGDYAATVEPESLMVSAHSGGGARGDIARLAGVRLALTTEVEDGARLAVGLIKRMTGADTLTARRIYREEFEFVPQFTLWIISNHRPKGDSADDGLWRRVKVLPFNHQIPEGERDPRVKQIVFTECLDAILAWAVEGCLAYQNEGLETPEAVLQAINDYRDSQDPLKDFIDACCVVGPSRQVESSALRQAYLDYCQEEGIRLPLSPKSMGEKLHALGFQAKKIGGKRSWVGLGLPGADGMDTMDSSFPDFLHEENIEEVIKDPVHPVHPVHPIVTEEF